MRKRDLSLPSVYRFMSGNGDRFKRRRHCHLLKG